MDYKQDVFYRPRPENLSKIPFYMAYPMQTVYMEELEYARDLEKLKGMYPKEVRSIQEMVEDECDKMEYEGSLMFDEYPDKVMVNQIVKRIYDASTAVQPGIQSFEIRKCEIGKYEREQYEEGMYPEHDGFMDEMDGMNDMDEGDLVSDDLDMKAEEVPLEGNLISRKGPGGPGWNPGGPGGPGGPGWNPGGPGWNPGRPPQPPRDNGLQNLIQVLLFNEMYQRRCRHKRCRRWW